MDMATRVLFPREHYELGSEMGHDDPPTHPILNPKLEAFLGICTVMATTKWMKRSQQNRSHFGISLYSNFCMEFFFPKTFVLYK